MNRPVHIWIGFALCAAVALAVLGWASHTILRLDGWQQQAAHQAEFEERVRLALWRMDSWLTPLIVEESARPATAYTSLPAPPPSTSGPKPGDTLVLAPLLTPPSTNILLYFQLHPDGRLSSPQVPADDDAQDPGAKEPAPPQLASARQRLAALRGILDAPATAAAIAQSPPVSSSARSSATPARRLFDPRQEPTLDNRTVLVQLTERPPEDHPAPPRMPAQEEGLPQPQMFVPQAQTPEAPVNAPAQVAQVQAYRNQAEFTARANTFQQAQQRLSVNNLKSSRPVSEAPPVGASAPGSHEGLFQALWLGDALVLARRVDRDGISVVQGCWLDWTNVRTALLELTRDLLPVAELTPVRGHSGEPGARMLAALPVVLHAAPFAAVTGTGWSPLRLSVLLAWMGALVAGAAVALLLHGTLSLSERRAAFVSAVTHELRTPLTTFQMYSEMLAEGMVPDPAKQRHYLNTLCSESHRLSHLVENVLAYARLERGSARGRMEPIGLGDLLTRVEPRLIQRAEQAGLQLVQNVDEASRHLRVRVDVSAVEQILFNLVDNACKYAAAAATERVIHLEAGGGGAGGGALFRVRDHGPGLSAEAAARLFQPFSKSAQAAAGSAPGVGLGLALARRLSRSMGGDLRWDARIKDGACFALSLPWAAP